MDPDTLFVVSFFLFYGHEMRGFTPVCAPPLINNPSTVPKHGLLNLTASYFDHSL